MKCKTCKFGAILKQNDSIWIFKKIYKKVNNKIICINYDKNEVGCRMNIWEEKEKNCLKNNYNEYIGEIITNN